MIKIGITQRVEELSKYSESRDCLDQRWARFLEKLNIIIVPIPNGLKNLRYFIETMNLNGFILSGGNDLVHIKNSVNTSLERDSTEREVLNYASNKKLPVLGICRGFQMINTYLGGNISIVNQHVATRHPIELVKNAPISFEQGEVIEVNSYHTMGLVVNELSGVLKAMAYASDGTIEAAFHEKLPWIGTMWHPEREEVIHAFDNEIIQYLFINKVSNL